MENKRENTLCTKKFYSDAKVEVLTMIRNAD